MAGLRYTTRKLSHMSRQWDRIADAMAAAHRGLAGKSAGGRLTEISGFGSNPGRLRMYAYVPADCPDGAPLVVALHGCGQDAGAYDLGSGWSRLADNYGFAVLLPEQQQANNRNSCFNWFQPTDTRRGRGEALSIRQMVEQMALSHCIDRDQVFITGLSAGGAMTSAMLAAYPDVFSAGAIVAGLPFGAAGTVQEALEAMYSGVDEPAPVWGDKVRRATRHKGPWPRVSVWQGADDTTVNPANAGAIVRQWRDVHGLPETPDVTDRVEGHPHSVWKDGAGQAVVELYTIEGMAHGLPLEREPRRWGKSGAFMLEVGISSSFHIASFFGLANHPAPSEEDLTLAD